MRRGITAAQRVHEVVLFEIGAGSEPLMGLLVGLFVRCMWWTCLPCGTLRLATGLPIKTDLKRSYDWQVTRPCTRRA
jgi:hypothetical protein